MAMRTSRGGGTTTTTLMGASSFLLRVAGRTKTTKHIPSRHRYPSPQQQQQRGGGRWSSSLRPAASTVVVPSPEEVNVSTSSSSQQQQQLSQLHPAYPHLFTPLDLGPHIAPLTNRVIMGSMHCGLEGHDIPKVVSYFLRGSNNDNNETTSSKTKLDHTEELAEYYAERALNATSLIVTGGISPNRMGALTPFGSKLSSPAEVQQHRRVTSRVSQANPDTKMILQILHAGRYANHPLLQAPSPIKSAINPFQPREMTVKQIQSTIQDYIECARLAYEAGYGGVEIMGSEGYLIHQFIATRTNQRKDEYGGSYRNRIRFALEIVRGIRQALPVESTGFLIMFRLSMLDLVENGSTWSEIVHLAKELENAGVTILNTGIGWHEARVPTIATCVPHGAFTWVTSNLKQHVPNLPLCTTNRINTPEKIEEVLRSGQADLVSMARPFLADEAFIQKAYEEKSQEINTCIGCNQACLDHVFMGRRASCLVNPRACHELRLPPTDSHMTPPKTKQNVAVIGAGPGGLACALTFARLGHSVTLIDSDTTIGGQFHMAKRIPGKDDFQQTLRYYDVMLTKYGAKRRLNTRIESMDDLVQGEEGDEFDRIVVSTGVLPRTPPIPNVDHPKVLSYVDVLKRNVKVGKKVAIIGAGGIGFDVAEFLLHGTGGDGEGAGELNEVSTEEFMKEWGVDESRWGRGGNNDDDNEDDSETQQRWGGLVPPDEKTPPTPPKRRIVLMQRKSSKVGKNLGKTTGWIHRAALQHGQVEMLPGCQYDEIDKDGYLHVTLKSSDGKTTQKRVLDVDNIILCAGQEKNDGLRDVLKSAGREGMKISVIGGAYEAAELDAKRAIDMGTRLAYVAHEHPDDEEAVERLVYGDREVEEEERLINFLKRFGGK